MKPFDQVVAFFGSQAQLAQAMQISPQLVHKWKKTGRIPVYPRNWVLAIEAATQGRVTRQQIRPDVYPDGGA